MKSNALLFLFVCLFALPVCAQHFSFGVQVIGLSYHLKKSKHAHLFKGKITDNGRLMLNGGVMFTVRCHVRQDWGVQFSQAIVAHDCSGRFLGMSHLGVFGRKNGLWNDSNGLDVSFGPMFFYRQNWALLPGYVDEGLFKISGNERWMTKFVWHGGMLSYRHRLSGNQYFQLDLLPGIPEVISIGPGISFQPEFGK